MTASTLLLYISLFLGAQILLGIAYGVLRKSAATALPAVEERAQQTGRTSAAWNGLRAFHVVRRVFEDAAQTQCSFYLEPVDGLALPAFKPGQFLTFSLPLPAQPGEVARTLTRCYSLSDSPAPDHYRVTIKRVLAPAQPPGLPDGLGSRYFHDHVHVGSILQLRAPSGHFHLDTQSLTPVVLVAGGIGITPMLSMLLWCAQHQPQRAVHLYFGVRNSAEQACKAALEDMASTLPQLRLHVVYSKPLPTDRLGVDYQHPGHVDLVLFKQTLPHGAHAFYICGPGAMLESLVPGLAGWGVASSDIHFEAFGPASVRQPADGAKAQAAGGAVSIPVHFQRSGRTLDWNGKQANLLDFAELHGIPVESGCRSGSCGSCVSTLLGGAVDYDSPPDYDLAPGQCLLCVGRPREALALDA
ncbi:FAD/NAD(P)-binding oxidoreductase [Rhodoferax lacus]|uniref:FAD/NAD(P)-binding oxidoreductase n=1 Tax=Rhodoferax lacus TaxID=2184758 RepID=A0A3E1RDE0_9BURK|nr:2Fe-2S iron-sulfur cluster-binding protein [Rhodoferax lacus]RFO97387.1 FAD/NAD(P)-binding oxidoreductase [Rhodoferax lacus]